MKLRLVFLCGLVLLMFGNVPARAAPTALNVWTQSVAYKVQPTTAPGSGSTLSMEGARGAYEAYQIIVTANGSALNGVNMSASALSDGNGHTIAASNLTFFCQAFIDFTGINVAGGNQPVPANSPTNDGRIPDALIPFIDPYTNNPVGAPFNVSAGLNQPIWLDVFIPKNTVAGTYTGNVTVTATGQAAVNVPITLIVWNFVLPDMNVVTTYFQMHADNLINYHGGIYTCSGGSCWMNWDASARALVKRYEELAHAHRIDTGQNFIVSPTNGCTIPTNWTAYDASMQPYMDGTYWSDGVPSGRLNAPFSPGATWGLETCTQAQYTALSAAWAAHLKAKGWFSRAIVFALDEPDPSSFPAIAQHSQWLQAGDPDWKAQVMDTTAARTSNVATLNPALGIYDTALAWYDKWWQQGSDLYGRAEWQNLFAQNIKLWFYESNAQSIPYPTYATNTLLGMEPQMMHWGAWYEYASGFLLWETLYWDNTNPWGPNTIFGKTGDGILIYPGNHNGVLAPRGSPADVAIHGPIPSYRLKMIREGLQDWALFKLADQSGQTAYARAQVAQAYGQLGGCTWTGCKKVNGQFFWLTDANLMQQIRHNIAQAIMGGGGTSTPTPTATATHTPNPSASSTPTATSTAQACTTKPGKPILRAPAPSAIVTKTRVLLDWDNAACAARYRVRVRQDSTQGAQVMFKTGLTISQTKTNTLTKGKTYFWKVSACNSIGCSASGWRNFSVQ